MKKSNTLLLKGMAIALLFACFTTASFAQIFWEEDFSDGMPSDWTNEDMSDNNAIWTWCSDPTTGAGNGCHTIFDDATNMQQTFQATTSTNGFVTIDSDAITASVANPHISVMTTPAIDCQGQDEVYLKFETHIGVYDLDAETNALIQISTNGTDFVDYTIFPGLTTGERWSANPEEIVINLTDIAANQPTVYVRWYWNAGWEYFWNIDDVIMTSENPIDPYDMRVNDNWFATATSSMTPASQVEPIGFLADIENIGSLDQTGVELNVTIVDDANPSTILYDETLVYGDVPAATLVENQLFPDAGFTPPATPASYTGTYTISSDVDDMDPTDNVRNFNFSVSEDIYAKDAGPQGAFRPADGNWDDTEPWSWAWGNFYYVPNGTGMYGNDAVFAIGNAADIIGEIFTIKLYRWDVDTNEDDNADPDERSWVGYNSYVVVGDETQDQLISIPILDVSNDQEGIALQDGGRYILMLEYTASAQTETFIMSSGVNDYGAAIFRSQELGAPRYAAMLGINEPLGSEPFSYVGFGWDVVPVVRFGIGDTPGTGTNTVDLLDDENVVEVYPNPASDFINVNIDLVDIQDEVIIEIVDLTGKIVAQRSYTDFQQDQLRFELNQLAAGSYYLNVTTPEGVKNVGFSVQR